MSLSGRAAVIGSVLSGISVGAAFGVPHGWIATQLALVFALWVLDSASANPRRAAGLAAVFSFSLFGAGFAGFVVGAPAALQAWALVPWFGWSTIFAAGAAAAAALACRVPANAAVRWGLLWPSAWMAMEWVASQGEAGIPWLRLGQQQAPNGALAGWLPVGGTLLAGLAMWLLAAALLIALRDASRRRAAIVSAGALLAGALALQQIAWTTPTADVNVALLQPGDKTVAERDPGAALALMNYYRESALTADAQLILTPQLALPKTTAAVPRHYWSSLHDDMSRRGADLVMGAFVAGGPDDLYNAALVLGASGSQQYLKHQLFPFGETLPLGGAARRWLDSKMARPIRDTLRGPAPAAPMRLAGRPVALSLCFEAAFAHGWREQAAVAELLVNMSSDSALVSSQIVRQATQHLQARALEFSKPALRTSDVDGTVAIDHRGRVQAALAPNKRAQLSVTVQARSGLTPYARLGESVAALAALLLACAVALTRPRTRAATWHLRTQRQSGQIMLPAIPLLLISSALLYLMVNSSQAVNEKTRVTNAADAAAYSAGVVEARALNFYAYTNRAMVANQIVIAQAISVGSWMRYFGQAARNVTDAASDIGTMFAPGSTRDELEALRVGATFAAAEYAMRYYTSYSPMDVADWALHDYAIVAGVVAFHDGVSNFLSANQQLVRGNLVLGVRQQQVADDLVREMDPALNAVVVPVTHGFDSFARSYSGDDRTRFADVTMRSRDPFTRERNWTLESRDVAGVRRDGALRKRGGTDLAGLDEWRAVDTLELHGQEFRVGCGRFGLIGWCDDIQKPIGWAGVNANNGGGDAGANYHGNAYRDNRATADNADDDMEEPTYGDGGSSVRYSGIPSAMELDNVEPDADRTSGVTIMVTKRHADMLTSGGAAQARPTGQIALFNDRPAGAQMIALSRAQVFFDRIEPRAASSAANRRDEIGSLYNPYWRVRLVAPVTADRGYAAARQGLLALP
jgi:apolipoprotein N-acyltransferase